MGQNGAGKTTLIKHFNGLLKPQIGTVRVDGIDTRTSTVAQLAKKVGFVFQNANHSLFAESVEQELSFTLHNFNVPEEEIPLTITKTLEQFHLEKYRLKSPFTLSGGEQKRLALAAVLCVNPKILVLDEPTIGQDAIQKKSLMRLLKKQVAQGRTVIIVTHDIEYVAEHIPRTIIMAHGEIIGDGPTESLLTQSNIIKETGLYPPELTRLSQSLTEIVPQFPTRITKIKQIYDAILQFFKFDFSLKDQGTDNSLGGQ